MQTEQPDFAKKQKLFGKLVIIFILLILLCACRVRSLPIFAVTITRTLTPSVLTATPSPLLTVTLTENPTPTITETVTVTPTVTGPVSALVPDQPWLAYLTDENGLVVLNQDGSGKRELVDSAFDSLRPADCTFGPPFLEDDSSVRAAAFATNVAYFVRPPTDMHILRSYPSYYCQHIDFAVHAGSGLLAASEETDEDAIPELVIYEMPGGKIHDRFPLVRCPDGIQCDFQMGGWKQLAWSPNGRYLAFRAMWDGALKNLYLYDSQDHSTRQLTSGPEAANVLSWSPDGEWVIIEAGESVQALSPFHDETRQLYTSPKGSQVVYDWLDDTRFLAYGENFPYAEDLRLVNLSGSVETLFTGTFGISGLDKAHGILVLNSFGTYDAYRISIENRSVTLIDQAQDYYWHDEWGLFVAHVHSCDGDPKKIKILTSDGVVQCMDQPVPAKPAPAERSPSPDGQWQVIYKDGKLLLEALNQTTSSITDAFVTQLIWCQDSTCFFFVANKELYRVSVSDLTLQRIDASLKKDVIHYQWLNARN